MTSPEPRSPPILLRFNPSLLVVGLLAFMFGYALGDHGKSKAEAERWQAVRDGQQCQVRAERAEARNTELKQQNQRLMEAQEKILRTFGRAAASTPEHAAVEAALAEFGTPP